MGKTQRVREDFCLAPEQLGVGKHAEPDKRDQVRWGACSWRQIAPRQGGGSHWKTVWLLRQ